MKDDLQKALDSITLPDIPTQKGRAKSVNRAELQTVAILTYLSDNAEDERTRELAFEMLQRFLKVTKKKS